MKVTKLVSQKKDSSRVNMYIDEEFFCGVSLNSVAKFNLYVGKDIDDKELDKVLNNELQNRFLDRAMSYISRSLRSKYQIERYLKELSMKKKGLWYNDISKDDLQSIFTKVIHKLIKYGYIDDQIYTEQFILSRIKNKPRGKVVLVSELMSKGIDRDIAREKVDELVEDEFDILKRVYSKKYKEEKITVRDRKKIDFLLRKGFSWDLIEKYINNESAE
jgi:regulatory protein